MLDKKLAIRTVGIGETLRNLFANCVMRVTRSKSNNACQEDQLCVGLKARIHRGVHGVKDIYDTKNFTEDWLFLLVDSNNTLNKII